MTDEPVRWTLGKGVAMFNVWHMLSQHSQIPVKFKFGFQFKIYRNLVYEIKFNVLVD